MIYEYNPQVVNMGNINEFYNKNKFVGYILPDGSIYQCKDHNVSDVTTVLEMGLELLSINYDNKNKFLDKNTNDKLMNIVLNFLNKISKEDVLKLKNFLKNNNLMTSDLLVQFFSCHAITRRERTIITSDMNLDKFYNYRLHDFVIEKVPKIEKINEEYTFVEMYAKDKYSEELESLRKIIPEDKRGKFHR